MYYDKELAESCHMGAEQTLGFHSPDGSTLLREMTSHRIKNNSINRCVFT